MGICSWCRNQYYGSLVFHICTDGTNFPQRMAKTSKELFEEYARQDRILASYREMQDGYDIMHWTPEDIEMLLGMKIKP